MKHFIDRNLYDIKLNALNVVVISFGGIKKLHLTIEIAKLNSVFHCLNKTFFAIKTDCYCKKNIVAFMCFMQYFCAKKVNQNILYKLKTICFQFYAVKNFDMFDC